MAGVPLRALDAGFAGQRRDAIEADHRGQADGCVVV